MDSTKPPCQRRDRATAGVLLLFVAASLSGCGAMRAAFEEGDQLPVAGDGEHVKVFTRWPGMDPWPTAQRYCEALGRRAWLREANNGRSLYDCLAETPGAAPQSPEPPGAARSAPSPRETRGALP